MEIARELKPLGGDVERLPEYLATEDYGQLLEAHLPILRAVVRNVSRRYRMRQDDAEELFSVACLKLVASNYAVLRKFQQRSGIRSYLTTIVSRVWLDLRTAREGKWRPSAAAVRLGSTAVALERLTHREGFSLGESVQTLRLNRDVAESVDQLHALFAALPPRRPARRPISVEELLEDLPVVSVARQRDEDRARRRGLARAYSRLQLTDRVLLRRRFGRGESVASIARSMSLDQRELYRHYDRLFLQLRSVIERDQLPMPTTRVAV